MDCEFPTIIIHSLELEDLPEVIGGAGVDSGGSLAAELRPEEKSRQRQAAWRWAGDCVDHRTWEHISNLLIRRSRIIFHRRNLPSSFLVLIFGRFHFLRVAAPAAIPGLLVMAPTLPGICRRRRNQRRRRPRRRCLQKSHCRQPRRPHGRIIIIMLEICRVSNLGIVGKNWLIQRSMHFNYESKYHQLAWN